MVKNIASNVKSLLEIHCTESLPGNDHIYFANDKCKDKADSLSVLCNAVCLWRTYLQLKNKFGKKVIDYRQIGINTKNPCLDSL